MTEPQRQYPSGSLPRKETECFLAQNRTTTIEWLKIGDIKNRTSCVREAWHSRSRFAEDSQAGQTVSTWTFGTWRRHYLPSKRRVIFTHRHSTMSQKTCILRTVLILTLRGPRYSFPPATHSTPDPLSPTQCNAVELSLCATHLLRYTAEGFLQRLSWQHCMRVTSPVRYEATKLFADSRRGWCYVASLNQSSPFPKSSCARLTCVKGRQGSERWTAVGLCFIRQCMELQHDNSVYLSVAMRLVGWYYSLKWAVRVQAVLARLQEYYLNCNVPNTRLQNLLCLSNNCTVYINNICFLKHSYMFRCI